MRGIDLSGRTFGRLVVLHVSRNLANNSWGQLMWVCRCSCGKEVAICGASLRKGESQSCGCLRTELQRKRSTTHGKSRSRTYSVWAGMKQRCENNDHPQFADYGGRGIQVCDRWSEFSHFLEDMGEAPVGLTLERKDTNLGYCPENCVWANRATQADNKRNTIHVTYKGVTRSVTQWAKLLGLSRQVLVARLYRFGWTTEDAMETPLHGTRRSLATPICSNGKKRTVLISYKGEEKSIPEWAKLTGLPQSTLRARLARKWPADKIIETPFRESQVTITANGITRTLQEWAAVLNLHPGTLYKRLKRGLSPAEIVSPERSPRCKKKGHAARRTPDA